MCGIAGIVCSGRLPEEFNEILAGQLSALSHRGPNDSDFWVDQISGVGLGHRRLSILELSEAGRQPMRSPSNRYVISFNGEIYNHLELRSALANQNWRGQSDTETLLAAIESWGVEQCLNRSVGMFAFALWDRNEKRLTLARDRFGEKPLYYGWTGAGSTRAFIFGSEIKALRAYPGFNNRISRVALSQYMRFGAVPAPLSIFEGIYKLEPGCLLTLRLPQGDCRDYTCPPANTIEIKRWWSFEELTLEGESDPLTCENEALDQLDAVLSESVQMQSLSDVPLGAFLSGGIDSSLIVALMQRQSKRPVETFTVGFQHTGYDEAPLARAVAKHLGTAHHEIYVGPEQALAVIPRLSTIYDEPFADSSQIPTFLVCQHARRSVTVALSGDGGDELFGGYNRYVWAPSLWQKFRRFPKPLRQSLTTFLRSVPPAAWNHSLGHSRVQRPGEKLHKLGSALAGAENLDRIHWNLLSHWQTALVLGESVAQDPEIPRTKGDNLGPVARMLLRDALFYLPNDILCKVDRAAMAVSLETRVPFLNHRVAELACRLPLTMKVRGLQGKWALRQVLYRYVPRELIERPKSGFAIPIGQWMRGPLRDWAEALIDEHRLKEEGYLNSTPIRRAWQQHLSGRYDWSAQLWTVLMFQAWLAAD